MTDETDLNEDNGEEVAELIANNPPEDVKEILEIAEDHGLDIEEAKEVKELADELGIDTDDAVEIQESL